MAKDIPSIERSIATPVQGVSAGNSFARLGDATNNLAQIISSTADDFAVAIAAKQGSQDAISGDAPKSLFPGINRATRAYNNAVSDTEARHLVMGAQAQVQDAFTTATSPANFTVETPALYKAQVQGIVDGTLEHTRDDNRAAVSLSLQKLTSDTASDMLRHSVNYDNKQTIKTMTTEVDQMVKDRRNAVIAGDEQRVADLDIALNKSVDDYAIQNAAIRTMAPEIRRKLDQNVEVDKVLGDFAQAASEQKQAQFLSDLAQNKNNLPFDTWEKVTKEVLALDATEKNLNLQVRSENFQTVLNGIDADTITTPNEIRQYPNLTAVDQLKLEGHLEKRRQLLARSQYDLHEAQKNIIDGHPGFNSATQKNAMFTNARHAFEQQTGQPMNIDQMWQSIQGNSAFPASGIPGVSLGADVPQFNAQLTNQLTSKDPNQVVQASLIFNDAVNVKDKPNMINLTGDALTIASNFNSLNLGNIDPQVLAAQVSATTLDANDADRSVRGARFDKEISHVPKKMVSLFKQVFDTSYTPGVSDSAMGVFKETLREQYLGAPSEEAAVASTRYLMRAWGESKYFENGMVGQPVPEKELAVANIGHAFDNQLKVNTQLIINQNAEAREANAKLGESKRNPDPFKIEWAYPNQAIDLKNLSDEDRVFKRLGFALDFPNFSLSQSKPIVKVNGQETELFLMPTPESRLGERLQYAMYYHDKFGMVQPVPDLSSPNGVAMFSPVGMEKWAPTILEGKNKELIRDSARRFQREKAQQDWEALKPSTLLGKLVESNFPITKNFRGTEEQRADIFKRMRGGDTAEIESLIRQRIQGENAATAPSESAKADNVGINAEQPMGNK